MRPHPVDIAIQSPARFDRVQLLVRLVIAVALGFVGLTAGWTGFALYLILPAVAAAYISSRGPDAYLSDVGPALGRVLAWLIGFHAYMLMVVDRPQTTGEAADVRVAIRTGGHPSVGGAILRLLTSLPAALLLAVLLIPASVFAVVGLLTILVSGSQLEPLLRFQRMVVCYAGRLAAYHADLVPDYPSLANDDHGTGTIGLAASTRLCLLAWVLVMIGLACRPPERHEPVPVPPSRPVTVSAMMHAHFAATRDIHLALIVDDLATAKARAREVAEMPERTGSSEWDRSARLLSAQAGRLASAPDANQARSLATQMATFCADCHMFRADPSLFRPRPVPSDDGSVRAAMARHAWGAETMWLGVIAPSTDLWREGMRELASAPRVEVDGHRAREVAILNARLGALATSWNLLGGQGDRARRLAEVMDVCAACHAISR